MSVGISQSLLSDKSVNINKRRETNKKKSANTQQKKKILAAYTCVALVEIK